MRDDLFVGPLVDLDTVLATREARVARRHNVFLTRRRPVVSLTIVMPGSVKDCAASRMLRDSALDTVMERFRTHGWAAEIAHCGGGTAGPEALVSVDADTLSLKKATIAIEDEHPLGRLWDLDVIDPVEGAISRRSLGLGPRRCFICEEPAHACARSRAHSTEHLLAAIKAVIDASRLVPLS